MKLSFALGLLATSLPGAFSHTIFVQLKSEGTTYGNIESSQSQLAKVTQVLCLDVGHGVTVPTYDGPQQNVAANEMACNGVPNPTTPTDKVIPVTAGSNVRAMWRHTLDSGPNDVMDPSHKGPVLAYLKKVSDAKSDSGVGSGRFNIQREGLEGTTWATDKIINGQGKQVNRIPECIEDGQYLLRAEMIALHGARTPSGAQFYIHAPLFSPIPTLQMECAQIEVTGCTCTAKPELVSIPGVYPANDPDIVVDIYGGLQGGYKTPGMLNLS
ncbi:hypothetical protein jhhlp_006064 [Lomentospora prolificans]|uniref:lytic cellulose monooxygenase (C4-dehydrogenating) n=1 Tax=Lomentospora prolificans TaxID=41688 RepID=A0A2N3N4U8_9PEZI|nr:hypothetical protein jhhlp_006064 [Lomentospora prolificans]